LIHQTFLLRYFEDLPQLFVVLSERDDQGFLVGHLEDLGYGFGAEFLEVLRLEDLEVEDADQEDHTPQKEECDVLAGCHFYLSRTVCFPGPDVVKPYDLAPSYFCFAV
jgi:hypothetical protein